MKHACHAIKQRQAHWPMFDWCGLRDWLVAVRPMMRVPPRLGSADLVAAAGGWAAAGAVAPTTAPAAP